MKGFRKTGKVEGLSSLVKFEIYQFPLRCSTLVHKTDLLIIKARQKNEPRPHGDSFQSLWALAIILVGNFTPV